VRILLRHFNLSATIAKEILVRDLGLKKLTRRWVLHTLSDPQKVTRVNASNEMLQIANDLEIDSFYGFQQATSHDFIISMSRRLCLRGHQAMSFQEREKKLV
jgi:hypothetical protein